MPVQDRWWDVVDGEKVPTARNSKGLRYRAYFVGVDRRQRSKSFELKRDADRWLEDQAAARNRGEWVASERGTVTVAVVWKAWIATKDLKPSTLDTYEHLWTSHVEPTFGAMPLNQVTFGGISEWIARLRRTGKRLKGGEQGPLSASRVRQSHHVLSSILQHAVKEQRIVRNPAELVDLPRLPKDTRQNFLTLEELIAIADECARPAKEGGAGQPMYRTMALVLGMTGIRWGEMMGLTISDVDPLRNRLHVRRTVTEVGGKFIAGPPKSGKSREVPLPAVVRQDLIDLAAGKGIDEPIFALPGSDSLGHSGFRRRAIVRAATKIGKPDLVPHEFRHTAASLAIKSGASIKLVQRMLGHSSAAMTLDLYGHLYEDEVEALSSKLDAQYAAVAAAPTPDDALILHLAGQGN